MSNKLEWYVIIEQNGKLLPYNVFSNRCIIEAMRDLFEMPELTYASFESELRNMMRWQFWARDEYEFVIYGWPTSPRDKGHKIDVFAQLEANWARFVEYVYSVYCFREEDEGCFS
jgi:hypothetical protein